MNEEQTQNEQNVSFNPFTEKSEDFDDHGLNQPITKEEIIWAIKI